MAIIDTLLGGTSVGSYLTGFMPQMILGDFLFSVNTAAFQEMNRETRYRWAGQDRLGAHEALQYLGPGADTISLPGVIFPSYRGGTGQIEKMRKMAARGIPLHMLDGYGNVYGRWVIEAVDEKRSNFAALGSPRKQEFVLKLRHYDGGGYNAILNLLSSLF